MNRFFVKLLRLLQIRQPLLVLGEDVVGLNVEEIRFAVFRRPALQSRGFSGRQIRLQRRSDFERQVALQRIGIGQLAIVALRPHLCLVRRVDQLHIDARAISAVAHTPFQHRVYAERFSDLPNIMGCSFVRQDGIAGNDF